MIKNSLKFKVTLYLLVTLTVATVATTFIFLKYWKQDLENVVARHVTQIADIVVASTRYTMLVNKRDIAEKIIEDIGKQKGIEHLRVINQDGIIVHSNRKSEVGYSLETQDEPCVRCHKNSQPLSHVPDEKRWEIFERPTGQRVLTSMQAIHNEASCSSESCHKQPVRQLVLGMVDIAYSLDEVDQTVKALSHRAVIVALGFIVFFSFSVGLLLRRLIYRPLKDLEDGSNKIRSGNLDDRVAVRNADEFGHVAESFNLMTSALKQSKSELDHLIQELESQVERRTKELLIARSEVVQGEKLASIGVLAAGIAHELNNPLTGVLTFTSLMRKKVRDNSEDAEDLDLVIAEVKRCASIIRRLLDFAREKVPVKGFFNLNQVIDDTMRFVERTAALQKIELKSDLDPELPEIWGDADLLKQVIMNLLVNAEQAIDGPGEIRVQSRSYHVAQPKQPGTEVVPLVEITITDSGCGIPESNLQRIFDPFFTSKDVGKGTGLGLSVSYGIIKAHGGNIEVKSIVGRGSTFLVKLPIAPSPGEAECHPGESTI